MTRTEDFVIDWVNPQTEKVLIVSCCSGHGFKFAPVLGKVISDVVSTGKSIEAFEKYKHALSIPYHRGVDLE